MRWGFNRHGSLWIVFYQSLTDLGEEEEVDVAVLRPLGVSEVLEDQVHRLGRGRHQVDHLHLLPGVDQPAPHTHKRRVVSGV